MSWNPKRNTTRLDTTSSRTTRITLRVHPYFGQTVRVVQAYGVGQIRAEAADGQVILLRLEWTELGDCCARLQVDGRPVRLAPEGLRELVRWVDKHMGGVAGRDSCKKLGHGRPLGMSSDHGRGLPAMRAAAVVRWAREARVQFPVRRWYAGGHSELVWKAPSVARVHQMLHNPIYAGAYVYGRRPQRKMLVDGQIRIVKDPGRDPESWMVRLLDAHPGYISWERYVDNQRKLGRNQGRFGGSTQPHPKRGALLLTGMLVCGRCGRRMFGVYRGSRRTSGIYQCKGQLDLGKGTCWSVRAEPIDEAVEQLFLQTAVPEQLALGLAVDQQVQQQAQALAQQWRVRIEKAGYEARRAERRYKAVDPDNRVVARTLEREWEDRLRELERVERDYERARNEARVQLTQRDRARIRELASDLRQVWNAPTTQQADRKAMLALVMEAITLQPVDIPVRSTRISVQWKAGAVDDLQVARPTSAQLRKPNAEALELIRELAAERKHDSDIAQRLCLRVRQRPSSPIHRRSVISDI